MNLTPRSIFKLAAELPTGGWDQNASYEDNALNWAQRQDDRYAQEDAQPLPYWMRSRARRPLQSRVMQSVNGGPAAESWSQSSPVGLESGSATIQRPRMSADGKTQEKDPKTGQPIFDTVTNQISGYMTTASGRQLGQEVSDGQFRPDLRMETPVPGMGTYGHLQGQGSTNADGTQKRPMWGGLSKDITPGRHSPFAPQATPQNDGSARIHTGNGAGISFTPTNQAQADRMGVGGAFRGRSLTPESRAQLSTGVRQDAAVTSHQPYGGPLPIPNPGRDMAAANQAWNLAKQPASTVPATR